MGVTIIGVLANSAIGEALELCEFGLPSNEPLNGCEFSPLPYFVLWDNTFSHEKMVTQTFGWQEFD